MLPILELKNNQIVLDVNTLIIPELRKCFDYYVDKGGQDLALDVFKYLYCMYYPGSPYSKTPGHEKEALIRKDIPGDYDPMFDMPLIEAGEKLKFMYSTVISRLYNAAKISLDNVSTYLATESLNSGRDGNSADIRGWHKELPTLIKNYKVVEAELMQEIATARGQTKQGIDEIDIDDNDFR